MSLLEKLPPRSRPTASPDPSTPLAETHLPAPSPTPDHPTPDHPTPSGRTLARSLAITAVLVLPALVLRILNQLGTAPALPPLATLAVFGTAVVAASFVLAWAAEAAQVDVSGGLAIAVLALVAVLPEYAVDLFYAFRSGSDPAYAAYAAANMTGSNRLLLGLGWPVVVLLSLYVAHRARPGACGVVVKDDTRTTTTWLRGTLTLDSEHRVELGFLLVAGLAAFAIPASGQIHLGLGLALIAWFGFYLWRLVKGEAEEPHLIGTAAAIGALPRQRRRAWVIGLFAVAAIVILASAEPFAEALVDSGEQLGLDRFLLVQWLAPLASETPEFLVAILFAWRGKGAAALGTLIASKVNQWTLLVGSLPIAHLLGGGGASLALDARQVEEMVLTASQTLLGVALLLTLRMNGRSALLLLGLFAVQFAIPGTTGRLVVAGVYLALAAYLLVRRRREVAPTLLAPFRA